MSIDMSSDFDTINIETVLNVLEDAGCTIDEIKMVNVSQAFVVRLDEDALVGYCSCRLIGRELRLNSLAIHPDRRRRG